MKQFKGHLATLAEQGMLRTLREIESAQGPRVRIDGTDHLLLCSNNYLGLANHPVLIEASCRAAKDFGAGSGASRLISGSMSLHHRLEERIAAFKSTESALVFNSGYAANNGIIQGLLGPEDTIFSDSLNHASIIDGCRLSGARTCVYPHNDVQALAELMAKEQSTRKGRWLIVTDGVFSMDGDIAPLPELVSLKERFDAWLMVDDAHGGGVLGEHGRGTAEHFNCLDKIDLQMGTFGKAFGSFGAYLAATRVVIDTLINRSRSFIFSTSLPPAVLAANLAAIDLVASEEGERRRTQLKANRELFSSILSGAGFDLCGSSTQIVPVLIGEPEPTMHAASQLFQQGIFLSGIRPPTVAPGTCRLRATLMADHTPTELRQAAQAIVHVVKRGLAGE
ncbi:8-amino-7-oxononanoate synthase [Malonomonas rubra DSM 5091]|uniref:8-amino-7-ketopelargonate synthase n=1 Tax=Malonomonas rubra DSM 5091 TaxID=1122189 RepID=A0A1M6BAD8_MALRU|nr:8-amino-7-oxononanoate synthase [Malonomonas rubra]SHI45720.1 8-amino-7-oxononanoate synthase [Malonomonas rubra DSM 5091]